MDILWLILALAATKGTRALEIPEEWMMDATKESWSIDRADSPSEEQVFGSETENRNVFSADRVRWTPSKSRFQPSRRPELEDELPLEEHQRRIQQNRGRRPRLRPGTQLENLGGGMLMDEDEYPRNVGGPQIVNSGKHYPFTDLKSLLKASGPSSLSEVLQQKNLSLEDFLRGSRNALSAITSSLDKQTENLQRRRPALFTRPPLMRRRTTTTPKSEETTTTTPISSGDPSRDILELIWRDDEGPSLAEILSSRNMTVEDLIEQKQRAAGREDISELFGGVDQEENKKEETRNFADFDILETDWNQNHYGDMSEEEDQEVTQSRTMYHVVVGETKVAEKNVPQRQISSDNSYLKVVPSDYSTTTEESKMSVTEERELASTIESQKANRKTLSIVHSSDLPKENLHQEEFRPIIRTRLAMTSTSKEKDIHTPTNLKSVTEMNLNIVEDEVESEQGLPMGVKGAIIASGCLLGIALLIFLGIFSVFRYRQWKRRGGASPYFCVAMLEAGEKKDKNACSNGWTDSIDSAQARLWRTLRRGRCRLDNREGGHT